MEELIKLFLEDEIEEGIREKFNNILKTRIEERVNLLCDDLSEIEKDKIKNIMFEKLLIK